MGEKGDKCDKGDKRYKGDKHSLREIYITIDVGLINININEKIASQSDHLYYYNS